MFSMWLSLCAESLELATKNSLFVEKTSVFLFIKVYSRRPSKHEAFIDEKTEWISDRFFTQQRLAGVNPMSLRRVTLEAGKTSVKNAVARRTITIFQVTEKHY